MRKLQQVMIVAAAAGSLTAVGAGAGATAAFADGGGHGHKSDRPHVSHKQAPTRAQVSVTDLYRPYQECSPQTVAEGDLPIGLLGLAETFDTTCGQFNNAFTD
ncbi:hypothetical protein ACWD1Y_00915 [Streptomyces sp. NPDC002814]|jgi:hypothetical protein|uniref:hypothetical protein n=1 Tax=Streptomyces sp. GESEQ-4 TaxID=2812655 RepID=UPI001B33E19C|nr:hypothetical protein [Streptomyces sp. GESEQ-4]